MGNDDTAAPEPVVLQEDDRPVEGWDDERGRLSWRPLFSADATPTEHLVTGVAELGEGGFLALHRHEQTETYYVTAGEGVVSLEGAEHPVRPGSTVFIPGSAEHGIRNTGATTLRFFYALAADDFTDVEYVFS
ncbi:cupin domain-containing protein [Kocuria arenosa]|uniref:cupin domain-containing protein n=1 Tax=Kocuria arenosa TaxID=3071446 RepID=UPI0034D42435